MSGEYLKCGHHASLSIVSHETGAFLYCDLCDAKSGRRDAEATEAELRAQVVDQQARIAELEKALKHCAGVIAGNDLQKSSLIRALELARAALSKGE